MNFLTLPTLVTHKLGHGKELVDRLSNLIAVFEDKALDFSRNRAEADDLLGDALGVPDAPLRRRKRQRQGPVLHSRRSQPPIPKL